MKKGALQQSDRYLVGAEEELLGDEGVEYAGGHEKQGPRLLVAGSADVMKK